MGENRKKCFFMRTRGNSLYPLLYKGFPSSSNGEDKSGEEDSISFTPTHQYQSIYNAQRKNPALPYKMPSQALQAN